MTCFWMVFVWNPTGPRKSKKPSQFWLLSNGLLMKSYWITQIKETFSILTRFEGSSYEILLDHANGSNLLHFYAFLNGFSTKSYWTKATFSNLPCFWMVFEWNLTRPRKSKQPSQFWPVFEWFWYEVLLDHANPRNLLNFDSFFNGFCMKSH